MAAKGCAERLAGKLAASVRVEDGTLSTGILAGVLQSLDAQHRPHVVVHIEALDTAVETVQHCRQIALAVGARDFRDVGEELFVWLLGRKVALDEIFTFLRLLVGLGDDIGPVFGVNRQAMRPTNAVDSSGAAGITAAKPESAPISSASFSASRRSLFA